MRQKSARALAGKRYAALEDLLDQQVPGAADLVQVLDAAPGVLVARAARLAADSGARDLVDALERAYARLHEDPMAKGAGADPGCRGKLALVNALRTLDARASVVCLHASRYRQLEAAWGPPVDTAGPLRCAGFAGLVEMRHDAVLSAAAQLLADPLDSVRAGAAECLGELDGPGFAPGAAALLRLRALIGDPEPEVVQACLAGLLRMAPGDDSREFVGGWLDGDSDSGAEAAAYALAGARDAQALECLVRWQQRQAVAERQSIALTAIALARLPRGFDYLFGLLEEAPPSTANAVIDALAVYSGDQALRDRALETTRRRGDQALLRKVETRL